MHALDGLIFLVAECDNCGRRRHLDLKSIVSERYTPNTALKYLEMGLRCTGCGARAREGATMAILMRYPGDPPISPVDGKPGVTWRRRRGPKLFSQRGRGLP